MTSTSTIGPGHTAGPAPTRPRAQITITEHRDGQTVITTWDTCHGVSGFVRAFLPAPTRQTTLDHQEPT